MSLIEAVAELALDVGRALTLLEEEARERVTEAVGREVKGEPRRL